jgi:transposase-like protein
LALCRQRRRRHRQRRHAHIGTRLAERIRQVATDLDLTETALREWVKRADADAGKGAPETLTTAEREELARLRRDNEAAGALAATTMGLICPNDGLSHVLLAHGIMMVVGAAVGTVFGGKVMRA